MRRRAKAAPLPAWPCWTWERSGGLARLGLMRGTSGLLALGSALAWVALLANALADRVEMADGRILEGRFALVAGVAIDPIAEATSSRTAGTPVLIRD